MATARPLFTAPIPGSPSVLISRPGDPPPFPATHPGERVGYIRRARVLLAGAAEPRDWYGRKGLDRITQDAVLWSRALASRLVRGATDLGGWFRSMLSGLVTRHYAGTLALTKGIIPKISVLNRLDERIDRQAGFLKRFQDAIRTGTSKGGQIVGRAGLYGAAIWGTAMGTERDAVIADPDRAVQVERRILDDGAMHCDVCPAQAALGWQPLGTLLPIGDTPCQSRCRCHFEYSEQRRIGPTHGFAATRPGSPSQLLTRPSEVVRSRPTVVAPTPPRPQPQPEPSPPPIPRRETPPKPPKPEPPPTPQPAPKPEPPKFGPSAARVRHLDIEDEEVERAVKAVLGETATKPDLASIAGATDNALVDVSITSKRELMLTVQGDGYRAIRRVKRSLSGDLTLDNEQLYVDADHQGQGIGMRVFGRQIETAVRLGAKRIDTLAAGGPGQKDVGYAVWPKLGYDGPIPDAVKAKLPPEHADAANLSDLMRTPEGRQWWTDHGQQAYLSFDLTEGSLSRTVWEEYLRLRADRIRLDTSSSPT